MPSVYYAVCPGTGGTSDKKTGSPTITIASGVATLSVTQTGNIGQGFRITYDTSKVCFISKVNSSTSFNVITATGGTPSNEASAVTVNSITADYASLSAAEAGASDSNHLNTLELTSGSYILNYVCYTGAGADTNACTFADYSTSATCYINVYTPTGGTQSIITNRHAGSFTTSRFYMDVTSGNCITLTQSYFRVDGLQFKVNSASYWGINASSTAVTSDVRVSNCIAHGNSKTARGFYFSALNSTAWNNIAYSFNATDYSVFLSCSDASGTLTCRNNTVYDSTGRGFRIYGGSLGSMILINNIAIGCTYDFLGTFSTGSNYNCALDASAPGANSIDVSSASDVFVDASGGNFALIKNSPCIAAGTDLSAYFTTDIAGTTRSTWDIGAFEYVSDNTWNTITPAKWNGVDWGNLKWNGM